MNSMQKVRLLGLEICKFYLNQILEVVYRVKKITKAAFRPSLLTDSTISDVNPSLLHLIRDCWSDEPKDRPNIKLVQTILKSLHNGKAKNLMDHVFSSKF